MTYKPSRVLHVQRKKVKITDNHNQQSNNNDKYESVKFLKKVMICHEKNKRVQSISTLKNASFLTSPTNNRNLYAYLVL